MDSLKGPCLMDLAELFQTSVDTLSIIFVISITAQAIGAFSCKYAFVEEIAWIESNVVLFRASFAKVKSISIYRNTKKDEYTRYDI